MGLFKRRKEKKTLWLATTNPGKGREFKEILKGWNVKTLDDLYKPLIIEETGKTFEENAMVKAKALAAITHEPAIGEDSGLCITKLNDFPGLYSHRWAFPETDWRNINQRLLKKMADAGLTGKNDRDAKFVSAIAYYDPHKDVEKVFTGTVHGEITMEPHGDDGFGYDPIFRPLRYKQTFAEMPFELKNKISHRRAAIEKLRGYLNNKWPGMNLVNTVLIWVFSGED